MKILGVIFQGYNKRDQQVAECVLLLSEVLYSVEKVFEVSSLNNYQVCSSLRVNLVTENRCINAGGTVLEAYNEANDKGYSFRSFLLRLPASSNPFKVPRFSEGDFEKIIADLGGSKIPESTVKTPDFLLNNIVLELKDIQTESLENKDRQDAIGVIFKEFSDSTVDLNPSVDYGEPTKHYRQLITATIQKHFKKASAQIKSFSATNSIVSSGIILINTGMFSLPHELLKEVANNILLHQTRTIKFAFLFSQIMQYNGHDLHAVFASEFIGDVPAEIIGLKDKVVLRMDQRMTEMVLGSNSDEGLSSLSPVSFLSCGKIFYWNPGISPDSRM